MEIDKNRGSPEFQRLVYKATFMDHFTDVANYYLKYGPDNNLDAYGEHWYLWQRYDSIGFLLKKGVIDLSYLDDLLKSAVIAAWNKFEPVIVDLRNKMGQPNLWNQFEFLAKEIKDFSIHIFDSKPLWLYLTAC